MQIDERPVALVIKVIILDLKGKMTAKVSGDLIETKIKTLLAVGCHNFLLNLEAVAYMDGAGLGEILRCYTSVDRSGGKLKLLHVPQRIRDLLSITQLLTRFEIYDSEEEAIRTFCEVDHVTA